MKKLLLSLVTFLFYLNIYASPANESKLVVPEMKEGFGTESIEGFNRTMYSTNRFIMRYGARPLGWIWGAIIPRWGQERIFNIFTNIEFPIRMMGAFCQNEWSDGGVEAGRFFINTTLGVAGMFDVAQDWYDIEPKNEDFAQVFRKWSIGAGAPLHLPVIGPTNFRDAFGFVIDCLFDPKTYVPVPGIGFGAGVNKIGRYYRDFDSLDQSYYDPYEISKRYYAILMENKYHNRDRISEVKKILYQTYLADSVKITQKLNSSDQMLANFYPQGPFADALKMTALDIQNDKTCIWTDISPWNKDFFYDGIIKNINIDPKKPNLEYKLWYRENAPLCVILPGTGTHFMSDEMTALAKIAYDQGNSVIILPNTFNYAFFLAASSMALPGYLPQDVKDIQHAIGLIINQIEEDNRCSIDSKILMGVSMGASQVLALAAQDKEKYNLKFDRYVACSPAVDFVYSTQIIDDATTAFKTLDSEHQFYDFAALAGKFFLGRPASLAYHAMVAKQRPDTLHSIPLFIEPLTEDQAKMLVAYNFNLAINDLLTSAVYERRFLHPMTESTPKREDFYNKLANYNLKTYTQNFIPAALAEKNINLTPHQIREKTALYQFKNQLKNRDDIQVFHAKNDFIINDRDLKFLKGVFKNNATIYPAGGHLGYFYHPTFLDSLKKQLEFKAN